MTKSRCHRGFGKWLKGEIHLINHINHHAASVFVTDNSPVISLQKSNVST